MKKNKTHSNTIALNKKSRFDYSIDRTVECGVVLEGWEVKSIRDGRVQLTDGYIQIRKAEAYLYGCHITPLKTASTHISPLTTRPRKLLLHRQELNQLIGAVERKGFTMVPIAMYWKNNRVKLEAGLGKGKKKYDKRATEKERDWNRQKQRLLKD